VTGVTRASRRSSRSGRRLPRRRAGQEPEAHARLQPRRVYPIPEGITIATPKPTEIVVTGIDKQQVGQVAAEIREYRRPSPTRARACVRRRVHLPQGRQEEVRSPRWQAQQNGPERRKARVRRSPSQGVVVHNGRPRLSRLPLGQEAYLRPDHRRREGPHARRRVDAREGSQGGKTGADTEAAPRSAS
jgi:hypothetical protein